MFVISYEWQGVAYRAFVCGRTGEVGGSLLYDESRTTLLGAAGGGALGIAALVAIKTGPLAFAAPFAGTLAGYLWGRHVATRNVSKHHELDAQRQQERAADRDSSGSLLPGVTGMEHTYRGRGEEWGAGEF